MHSHPFGRARSRTSLAVIAQELHLFPFRTEKLSPAAPMVLGEQAPGRVGRRQFSYERPAEAGLISLWARDGHGCAAEGRARRRSPAIGYDDPRPSPRSDRRLLLRRGARLRRRRIRARQAPGCGAPIRTCDVWHGIRAAAGELSNEPFAGTEVAWRDASAAAAARHMLGRGRGRTADAERALGVLLQAIRAATGASVIVDSSKGPGYAALLARLPAVELTLVHVVREPAAIVASRQSRSARIGRPDYLSTRQLGLMWTLWNPALELARRADATSVFRTRRSPRFRATRSSGSYGSPAPTTTACRS